jgi:transcriptional regulator with XRE-family HTH domain
MSLSEKIKSARKQAGLTQQELADLIGVANSTVAGYEKGVREPDALKLKLIAKHTGVTGDYLLELDEDSCAAYSPEALALAEVYDRLDPHSKRVVDTVAKIEAERVPVEYF